MLLLVLGLLCQAASTDFVDVTGTVLDHRGQPLEGADVEVFQRDQDLVVFLFEVGRSLADGTFRIRVPLDTVRYQSSDHRKAILICRIEKVGFQIKRKRVFLDRDAASILESGLGEVVLQSAYPVWGTVVDGLARPVEGAEVTLRYTQPLDHVTSALTDSAGLYRLDVPRIGVFDLSVRKEQVGTDFIPDVSVGQQTSTMPLSELKGHAFIEGMIVFENGEPVRSHEITAIARDDTLMEAGKDPDSLSSPVAVEIDQGLLQTSTKTNNDGFFRLSGLFPGRYTLHADCLVGRSDDELVVATSTRNLHLITDRHRVLLEMTGSLEETSWRLARTDPLLFRAFVAGGRLVCDQTTVERLRPRKREGGLELWLSEGLYILASGRPNRIGEEGVSELGFVETVLDVCPLQNSMRIEVAPPPINRPRVWLQVNDESRRPFRLLSPVSGVSLPSTFGYEWSLGPWWHLPHGRYHVLANQSLFEVEIKEGADTVLHVPTKKQAGGLIRLEMKARGDDNDEYQVSVVAKGQVLARMLMAFDEIEFEGWPDKPVNEWKRRKSRPGQTVVLAPIHHEFLSPGDYFLMLRRGEEESGPLPVRVREKQVTDLSVQM